MCLQHQFKPEPLYKLTGKGYVQSDVVAEITRLKEEAQRGQRKYANFSVA
jgi:hypothetical protein